MLESMKIKGFRSFSQESYQEIKFSKINIIVGENNAGKSNILKAIQFALDPEEKNIKREDFSIRRSESSSKKKKYSDKKARQIEIILRFNDRKLLPKKYVNRVSQKGFELKLLVEGNKEHEFKKYYYLNDKDVEKMHVNQKLDRLSIYKELLKGFGFHIAPTIRDIDYLEIFKEMLPLTGRSDIKRHIEDFSNKIKSKMKPYLRGMKNQLGIEGVEFSPQVNLEKLLYDTRFDFFIDEGYQVPLRNVGQGYISQSIISLATKVSKQKIIGIEELELHMHPNAIRHLIKDIRSLRKQIIVTSHSPTITNFVEPSEIILARKENRYTKVYQLEKMFNDRFDDYKRIDRQIFLNKQKSELLFAKGIILVEGHYDRVAYTILFEKFRMNLLKAGISIIDVGSDAGFLPYIRLADEMNIRWVVVADRKAIYDSSQRDDFGSFTSGLRKNNFISAENARSLVSSCSSNNETSYQRHVETLNRKLLRKNGAAFFIKGEDLSNEIISSFRSMQYRDQKLLFQKFRGSRFDKNKERVRQICERKLRNKDWDMITAAEQLGQKYLRNFKEVLEPAFKFLTK
jgi:putative ATP-dependent endonuclease of OLD family